MDIFILKEDFFLLTKIFLIFPKSYIIFNSSYLYPSDDVLLSLLNKIYSKYFRIYFKEYVKQQECSLHVFELKLLKSISQARHAWLSSQTLPSQSKLFFKLVVE
jgi:hypothetical protein